jgi:predicted phage-related endonuclease
MAGKLTDDKRLSASRLPGLMGFSKYSTPNDELQYSINAIDGKERPDISNQAMAWGNHLEPIVLTQAAARLGLTDVQTQINQAYSHESVPISCSLDGIGIGNGQTVVTNTKEGIYVIGQESIVLSGPGVLEAKVTKAMPEEVPHLARGVIQLQGQLLITGHTWGAVCVLYQGIELRVFLFAVHYETQKEIIKAACQFQSKLDAYVKTGSIDWYPPSSSFDLNRMYGNAQKEEIELPNTVADIAKGILENKAAIRAAEASIEEAEMLIKANLGQAERGRVGQYVISWPMRNFKAAPERYTPAKEAYSVRQSTVTIKEITA